MVLRGGEWGGSAGSRMRGSVGSVVRGMTAVQKSSKADPYSPTFGEPGSDASQSLSPPPPTSGSKPRSLAILDVGSSFGALFAVFGPPPPPPKAPDGHVVRR